MDFYVPVSDQLHKALVCKLGSLNFERHGGDKTRGSKVSVGEIVSSGELKQGVTVYEQIGSTYKFLRNLDYIFELFNTLPDYRSGICNLFNGINWLGDVEGANEVKFFTLIALYFETPLKVGNVGAVNNVVIKLKISNPELLTFHLDLSEHPVIEECFIGNYHSELHLTNNCIDFHFDHEWSPLVSITVDDLDLANDTLSYLTVPKIKDEAVIEKIQSLAENGNVTVKVIDIEVLNDRKKHIAYI